MTVERLFELTQEAAVLGQEYPPRLSHPGKKTLLEIAGRDWQGSVQITRWRGDLPEKGPTERSEITPIAGFYSYSDSEPDAWHVNFADPNLFGYYGGSLFAQDEFQVAEHPVLASVREAMLALAPTNPRATPRTAEREPTPVLVTGAERRIEVHGIYGNAFAAASEAQIKSATKRLEPPTITNVLAMAAPYPGNGPYEFSEIRSALRAAYVGFAAAKEVTGPGTVVHTGHWGCGAFGGNQTLMALVQMYAASLAGVDVAFHTASSSASLEAALDLLPDLERNNPSHFMAALEAMHFEWGVSNET